jgi:hypothetical protein
MLRAGALMYAMVVILLSSVVTGMVITGLSFQRELAERVITRRQLDRNIISSAVLYSNGGFVGFPEGDTFGLDLYKDSKSEVILTTMNWGGLEVLTVEAVMGRERLSKNILFGTGKEDISPIGLYLSDKGRFLSLSGDTRLSGDCYLPAATARVASIEGRHFQYKEIARGRIFKSEDHLVEPDPGVFSFIRDYLSGYFQKNDSIVLWHDFISERYSRPFGLSTVVITGPDHWVLEGIDASGRLVFLSDSSITVNGDSYLSDVVLISRDIVIGDDFDGSLQAFAYRSICVGENCNLLLPSVLAVSQENKQYLVHDSITVKIGEGSIVSGNIILKSEGLPCYLKTEAGSRVIGLVYCQGQVSHGGFIEGSLYCDGFYLKTPSSWYLNHLLDNRIELTELPDSYAGVDIFGKAEKKTILKWLQ